MNAVQYIATKLHGRKIVMVTEEELGEDYPVAVDGVVAAQLTYPKLTVAEALAKYDVGIVLAAVTERTR